MKMLDSENKLTGIADHAPGWMNRAGGDVVVLLHHAAFLLKPQLGLMFHESLIETLQASGLAFRVILNLDYIFFTRSPPDISQQTSLPFCSAVISSAIDSPELLISDSFFFHEYFTMLLFSIRNEAQVPFKDADDKLIGIRAILPLSQKPPSSEIKLSMYMLPKVNTGR